MTYVQIREGLPNDAAAWTALRSALWPDNAHANTTEIREFFAGDSNDIVKLFVAEEDAEIVGFIELNLRNFAEGSRRRFVPYVEAWFVREDSRGAGVGQALMRRAEVWAREVGFTEIASDTEIDNLRSIALHKALGFEEVDRVVCFLKPLSSDD